MRKGDFSTPLPYPRGRDTQDSIRGDGKVCVSWSFRLCDLFLSKPFRKALRSSVVLCKVLKLAQTLGETPRMTKENSFPVQKKEAEIKG